ncbi:MAG: hypothetical protein AABZ53_07040 [Planctomycetota bacterium]
MRIVGSNSVCRILGAAGAVALALCCSCGGDGSEGGGPRPLESTGVRQPIAPPERLDVAWSSTLVVPLRYFEGDPAARAGRFDSVRLDDGRLVDVLVRTLVTAPGANPAVPPGARAAWMTSVGRWSTREIGESKVENPMEASADFAIFAIPGGAMGQGLWIGGRRVSPNWLVSSRTIADRDATVAWGSPLSEVARRSAGVVAAAAEEAASPFRRWRSRLALGTLLPTQDVVEHPSESDRFMDPALEIIAEQVEERWRVALGLLWADDRAVCERVRRRLTLAAEIMGEIVPVWPTSQASLDDLVNLLLDPRLGKGERARAAEQWESALPICAAWVVSDASSVDAATRLPVAEIGAVNLSGEARLARLVGENSDLGAGGGELSRVEPLKTIRLMLGQMPEYGVVPARTARLQLGDWTRSLTMQGSLVRAEPPGLLLGPLEADHAQATFAMGLGVGEGGGRAPAAVSLIRGASATAIGRKAGEGWRLHVEFAGLPGELVSIAAGTPTLRVWTGAPGRGRALVTVPTSDLAGPPSDVTRGWAAEVPIALETSGDGVLLIGIDFTDAIGRHYAWPRPMFPWQSEPSRAAIDLSAWDGLGAPDGGRVRPGS